jgi:glc operon protein GlcG
LWEVGQQIPHAAAAAIAEAQKNNWKMVIAIVETGGYLVYFEKM